MFLDVKGLCTHNVRARAFVDTSSKIRPGDSKGERARGTKTGNYGGLRSVAKPCLQHDGRGELCTVVRQQRDQQKQRVWVVFLFIAKTDPHTRVHSRILWW